MPLYTGVHKGQRRWLADLMTRAGRTDFSQKEEVDWLQGQLRMFTAHLKEHAELEERFIHPRLATLVPGCHRGLEDEHRVQHEALSDLIGSLDAIRSLPPDHPTLPLIGQEFYLALNRFISGYLRHIDYEEEHVQNILWNDCTPEELMSLFNQILRAQSQESLTNSLIMMLTAMNVPEIVGLLSMAKGSMPPAAYDNITAKASQFADPSTWAKVQAIMAKR
jgi:hemerythrin-like domain-containing protein